MRTLIIGAGLGGLCLAHGLRKAGVDVEIFERRPSPVDQPATYGIHLNADGLRALHACLPAENWTRLVDAATPARDLVRFHDQQLRALAVRDKETQENATDPITRRRAISRAALRDALLIGLDVRWGKEFNRYEYTSDDGVAAAFVDGSSAVGELLVGADGSNSRVRQQRLPNVVRQDLGVLNIVGRVPLTPELAAALPAALTDGSVNNIVPPGPGWLFVSTWQADQPADAKKYVVWAWAAARGSYPADVEQRSPAELRQLVADRVSGWAPGLRRLIADTDPSTVAPVPLRTMPILDAWQPTAVTLLGDAIHNMTPMAGIGANTALRDAAALRDAVVAVGPDDVVGCVGEYEQRMRGYANQALALSTRNARNAAAEARLPRLAFRSMLRVASVVPPVNRAMFGSAK
jgi:2-polyprenyl-6-methoxyphenol hydroxylase-like FAD-dependent oxidoreductase